MSSAQRTSLIGIVAMTARRIIGRDGTLPWHLPDDLAFFKNQTSGHAIIMGRKTFDSIGRPLPKRHNIVLTRDLAWSHPGVQVIHSPVDLAGILGAEEEAYIIGGAEIYQAFLPHMDSLIITHVKEDYEGDTRFPDYAAIFPHEEVILEHPQFTVKRHTRA